MGRDDAQAADWYRKAAEQGFATAENNLGRLYALGQGVPQNYVEAMMWFQKAAAQGDGSAMNNIGRLYGEGDGTPQDKVEALKWLDLASARYRAEHVQEPGYATENRVGLATTMTAPEIAEAQRRANLASLEGERPTWVTRDDLALLAKIGIDAEEDVENKENYHWRWRAKRELSISTYTCPVGSTVDVSRTIVVAIAPTGSFCRAGHAARASMLKLFPDGSAEPLSG